MMLQKLGEKGKVGTKKSKRGGVGKKRVEKKLSRRAENQQGEPGGTLTGWGGVHGLDRFKNELSHLSNENAPGQKGQVKHCKMKGGAPTNEESGGIKRFGKTTPP